ncbi:hypothetical protein Nepgr_023281 [Nepenthes gracilis]|uniref:Uncharacterized protein n=1 Tax=Nepenthes gracilis TaxID=150966 RepID=A0AAD3T2R7_NEPGR|nr:hypothetical protein Nepgr_023281 [Nepenthes gracilis]
MVTWVRKLTPPSKGSQGHLSPRTVGMRQEKIFVPHLGGNSREQALLSKIYNWTATALISYSETAITTVFLPPPPRDSIHFSHPGLLGGACLIISIDRIFGITD